MKSLLSISFTLLLSTITTHAQDKPPDTPRPWVEPESIKIDSPLIEPGQSEPRRSLPEIPRPSARRKTGENSPCPAGIGKPCALLGGRRYFPDPLHMTEHEMSWGTAMKRPAMLFASASLIASTVVDIEMTQRCIAAHACREANPIMGSSRARQYGIGMSLNAIGILFAGKLKKDGDGTYAFAILWGTAIGHAYGASKAASAPSAPIIVAPKNSLAGH